jgi:hypothetical protein
MHHEQPRGGGEIERAHDSCDGGDPREGPGDASERIEIAEYSSRHHSATRAAGHPPGRRQANPAIPFNQSDTLLSHCPSSQITDLSGPLGQCEPLSHRTTVVFETTLSVESGSNREADSNLRVELAGVLSKIASGLAGPFDAR